MECQNKPAAAEKRHELVCLCETHLVGNTLCLFSNKLDWNIGWPRSCNDLFFGKTVETMRMF